MKNKTQKTNKQGLTFIAERLDITLTQLAFYYTLSDDFKEIIDDHLNEVNPRRIENGLEKLDVMKYVKTLCKSY